MRSPIGDPPPHQGPLSHADGWRETAHRPGKGCPEGKGGRHHVGPAAHPDFPSVAGAWWPLSHVLLGRNRVGCSGPDPALSRSRACSGPPWREGGNRREGCDGSGGRKFLLPALTPSLLRCPSLWQVVFCSFTSTAAMVSLQSHPYSPCCFAAGLPSCPAQPPPALAPSSLCWRTPFLLVDLTSAINTNTLIRWLRVNGRCTSKRWPSV